MKMVDVVAVAAAFGTAGTGCTDNPVVVTITVQGAAVIAAEDGDGPWQQLAPDAAGHARFEVTSDRYGLASLCADQFDASADVELLTTEIRERTVSCSALASSFRLTGTAAPGAEVFVDSDSVLADASGGYVATARAGLHDVFAVLPGAPAKIYAARDVELAADRVLDLAVASQSVDMLPITPTVVGADGPVTVYSDLTTARDEYVYLGDDPTTVMVPPPSVLVHGDRPAVGASAGGCTAQQPATTDAPTLVIPGAFSAAVAATELRWTADAHVAWDTISVTFHRELTGTQPFVSISYRAVSARLDASGHVLPLVDVTTLPGWRPGMPSFDAGQHVTWDVWTSRGDPAGAREVCGTQGALTW